MSSILVDITSQAADSAVAAFTEVVDLSETVTVPSGTVVLLIAVVPLDQGDSADEAADFRFAIDDVLVGPEITAFKDNIKEGCGVAICFAKTGLSGSTKFALQWRNRQATAAVDTGRVRSLQVISITDASLLVDISSTSADSAVSGYTDIDELVDTKTPASADSILVLLANVEPAIDQDATASYQFTIGGSAEGPESKAYEDDLNEGCGISQIWCKTGLSGATAFAVQWDELVTFVNTDTGRVRTFQIIEITANANLLTAVTSVSADALESAFTDVVDLVDTVTVQDTDSILLFAATLPLLAAGDRTAAFRVFEGGTGEGPEQYVFSDSNGAEDKACGHSVYHAVTGKSAGSHTFSIRGQNVQSTANLATAHRRSFCILELLAAVAQVDKEASDTLDLAVVEGVADLLSSTDRLDDLDLEVNEDVALVDVGITDEDTLDLEVNEDVADLLGLIEPEDTTGVSLDELTEILARAERLDDLDLSVDEVAELLGILDRDDTLDIEINEDPALVVVGISAEDLLDQVVNEDVANLLGLIEPEDTTGVSVDELAEILARAERLDTLDIDLIEAAELLARLARTDDLDLEIVEDVGQVSVEIQAADDVDLEILEGVGQVVVGIQVQDTLSLALIEATTLLALLDRSDSLDLALVEGVPLVFVSLNRDDLLDLEIVEGVGQVVVGISAADTLDLAVVEAVAQLVVAIQVTDLLDLSVSEVAELVAFLNRSDILDLDLGEQADLLAFIEAADDLDIEILDVAALVVVIQAADDLDLDIGEVAEVVAAITALDNLDLEINEAPGIVVESIAFEGIITKAITLQVLRTQRITLPVTKTVRFILEIDPGVQR